MGSPRGPHRGAVAGSVTDVLAGAFEGGGMSISMSRCVRLGFVAALLLALGGSGASAATKARVTVGYPTSSAPAAAQIGDVVDARS